MQYRNDRYGKPVSLLGYGCMRFSKTNGKTDVLKTEKEILKAVESGVTYFDTAYTYSESEATLGEIVERNLLRDKITIATKLPHYLIKKEEDAEKFFTEELRRLRTDHVDYYLMHMLTDDATWERLKGLKVDQWLLEKKRSGQIREFGFSYHGNADVFKRIVDAFDWDFCQIQYNYMDEHSQAGVEGLKYAAGKGLPVIIMEPLRGGRLANGLPKAALEKMEAYPEKRTPAEWGFRWLYDQPEVTCVLSGMNSVEMVEENVKIASEARVGCMSEADKALLRDVVAIINDKMKVGCTGCRYCMPCPQNVDIPGIFAAYNRIYSEGKGAGIKDYFMTEVLRRNPTGPKNCIGCGKCELHCPQHIEIRKELKNAHRALGGPLMTAAEKLAPRFLKY